jgi:putative two-component system response regulator
LIASTDNQPVLLLVDDNLEVAAALTAALEQLRFQVVHALTGTEALACVANSRPDVAMVDMLLPDMSGFEVCERMKRDLSTRHVPVIMMTDIASHDAAIAGLKAGADDLLIHPIDAVLLEARLRCSVRTKALQDQILSYQERLKDDNQRLEDAVRRRTAELERTQHATAFSLAKLAESRDPETGEHLERMRRYVRELAIVMGTWRKYESVIDSKFVETVYYASPLHDIGKVGIQDDILLKPGKLTDDKFDVMKTHTIVGGDTLKAANEEATGNSFLEMGCDIAYFHHEKWNGRGYPFGISGETIPLAARIVALGDAYDALTTKRPYKEAFSHDTSRDIIVKDAGEHFDPDVVEAFLEREHKFIRIKESLQDAEPAEIVEMAPAG